MPSPKATPKSAPAPPPPHCEFFDGGEIFPNPHWRVRPHRHGHHELIAVKSGSMVLKTGQGEIEATSGDLLFYEAGLFHEEISCPANPVNTLFIAFKSDAPLSLPLRLRDPECRLPQLLAWLLRDWYQGRPTAGCQPMMQTIVGELRWLAGRPAPGVDSLWLQRIRHYLRLHLGEPIRLETLARHCGMSPFALIRKFKRLAGRTPMEELRLLRLEEARRLLLTSPQPLKAIAPAVGIGDEFQLSKLFRRHFGLSPGALRRERDGGGAA